MLYTTILDLTYAILNEDRIVWSEVDDKLSQSRSVGG